MLKHQNLSFKIIISVVLELAWLYVAGSLITTTIMGYRLLKTGSLNQIYQWFSSTPVMVFGRQHIPDIRSGTVLFGISLLIVTLIVFRIVASDAQLHKASVSAFHAYALFAVTLIGITAGFVNLGFCSPNSEMQRQYYPHIVKITRQANRIVRQHQTAKIVASDHFQRIDGTTFKINGQTYAVTNKNNVITNYERVPQRTRTIAVTWTQTDHHVPAAVKVYETIGIYHSSKHNPTLKIEITQ